MEPTPEVQRADLIRWLRDLVNKGAICRDCELIGRDLHEHYGHTPLVSLGSAYILHSEHTYGDSLNRPDLRLPYALGIARNQTNYQQKQAT
jgi:hypothetical protein